MDSPKLFFNIKFHQESTGDYKYILGGFLKYIDDMEKCDHSLEEEYEKELVLKNGGYKSFIDYAAGRDGSTGLFSKNGRLSPKERNNFGKNYKGGNIWKGILSFDEEYAIENKITMKEKIERLFTDNFETIFKGSQIDPNNINWVGAYHPNTNNPHIHFIFYEGEKTRINHTTKELEWNRGKIGKEGFSTLKRNIVQEIDGRLDWDILANKRKDVTKRFKEIIQRDKSNVVYDIERDLYNLCLVIPRTGKIGYGTKEIKKHKKQIDAITNKLIKKNIVTDEWDNWKATLENIYDKDCEVQDNIGELHNKRSEFIYKRKEDMYRRLGNIIIKKAIEMRDFVDIEGGGLKAKKIITKENSKNYNWTRPPISLTTQLIDEAGNGLSEHAKDIIRESEKMNRQTVNFFENEKWLESKGGR